MTATFRVLTDDDLARAAPGMPPSGRSRLLYYEHVRAAGAIAHALGIPAREAMAAIHSCTDIDADDTAIRAFYRAIAAENKVPPPDPPELRHRSRRQQAIWRYFRDKWARHHLSPTVREIQRALGISSTSVVVYNLATLERAGLIEHLDDTTPAYRLPAAWR